MDRSRECRPGQERMLTEITPSRALGRCEVVFTIFCIKNPYQPHWAILKVYHRIPVIQAEGNVIVPASLSELSFPSIPLMKRPESAVE